MKRLAPLAAVLALVLPSAAFADSPSLEQALLAADREWPGHACEGRVNVIVGPTTTRGGVTPDGEATGLESYWDGIQYRWVRASCAITVRPGLEPHRRCRVVVHEVGHLARGDASHDEGNGMMSAVGGFEGAEGCNTRPAPKPSPRTELIEVIRGALPDSHGPWAVTCTPNAVVMRCRAQSPLAEHVRRYAASIDGNYRRTT